MNSHYAGLMNAVKTNVIKLNLVVKCYLEYHVNIMVHEYKKTFGTMQYITILPQSASKWHATETPSSCVFFFSIMHGAETAWLNDVRRTRVSLHKSNSFPCWMRAVFEYCGVSVWLGMRGASRNLWQNSLVLQVQSDVKIIDRHRPASSRHISVCCAPSGNTCRNRPAVVLYSLWHRFPL